MNEKKSITIRGDRGARVKIFTVRCKDRVDYEVRWTDHNGDVQRMKRSLISEAKKEAKEIADKLDRGEQHAQMHIADLASWRSASFSLRGCGKTIELVAAEYAEVIHKLRAANVSASFAQVTDFFLAHQPKFGVLHTVAETVKDFLDWKRTEVGTVYHDHLRSTLKPFVAAHPGNMAELTADGVHRWLRGIPKIGARYRNNLLGSVKAVFSMPALQTHPARAAIARLPEFRTEPAIKLLWTPAEFRLLLDAAPAALLPVLVLGGFCKMRTSEIRRTKWEQLRLEDGQLILMTGQTKTKRARVVPMPACAVEWLRMVKGSGLVWPHCYSTLYKQLAGLSAELGLTWRQNALRKSACTYDELSAPGLERNSREAGNSPTILEMNYLSVDVATRDDARQWFNLFPKTVANPHGKNPLIVELKASGS